VIESKLATNRIFRRTGWSRKLRNEIQLSQQGPARFVIGFNVHRFLHGNLGSFNVTSRLMGSSPVNSEALLLIDEPAPGAQFGCSAATCPGFGNGAGAPSELADPSAGDLICPTTQLKRTYVNSTTYSYICRVRNSENFKTNPNCSKK
jgi:hypothetical protein